MGNYRYVVFLFFFSFQVSRNRASSQVPPAKWSFTSRICKVRKNRNNFKTAELGILRIAVLFWP